MGGGDRPLGRRVELGKVCDERKSAPKKKKKKKKKKKTELEYIFFSLSGSFCPVLTDSSPGYTCSAPFARRRAQQHVQDREEAAGRVVVTAAAAAAAESAARRRRGGEVREKRIERSTTTTFADHPSFFVSFLSFCCRDCHWSGSRVSFGGSACLERRCGAAEAKLKWKILLLSPLCSTKRKEREKKNLDPPPPPTHPPALS